MKHADKFELQTKKFLLHQFGTRTNFFRQGVGFFTTPDVNTLANKYLLFYIKHKFPIAQCGQFGLYLNQETGKCEYSDRYSVIQNKIADKIIDYINSLEDGPKETPREGMPIEFENCDEIFKNWVINTYHEIGIKYFIDNTYKLLPIEKLWDYFNISAKYAIKRADSSPVGSENARDVIEFSDFFFPGDDVWCEGDRVYIQTERTLFKAQVRAGEHEYVFTKRDEDVFEYRKLSNEFIGNVAFSIELKSGVDVRSIADLIFVIVSLEGEE